MQDYVSGEEFSEEENTTHFAIYVDSNPVGFDDAIKEKTWRKSMDLEIEAIEKNNTRELTDLPAREKSIGVKWIFKTKLKENGENVKYKARLVAKRYNQRYGIDYVEVLAPVA